MGARAARLCNQLVSLVLLGAESEFSLQLTNRSQPFNVPSSAFATAAPRSRLHSLTWMDWRQLKVAEAELEQKQLALEALKVQPCTKCESLAEQLAAQSTQLFAAVSSANTLTHELWQKVGACTRQY